MKKNPELAGLSNSEKSALGKMCEGIELQGEIASIAVNAIVEYRQNENSDVYLALDVGIAIREAYNKHVQSDLAERVTAVRKAVDDMLRGRS